MRKIALMALQDEISKCNNGGGCKRGVGRPSKMPKPKKVPQRGLGVAQLERIRLEEEQKENNAAAEATTAIEPSSSNSPYDMHLQLMKFHQSNQPPSSNSSSSNTVLFATNSGHDGHSDACCWRSVPVQGYGGGPHKLYPTSFQFEKKNLGMDPKLPVESNPVKHLPNWLQEAQQKPTSSMVVVSSGISSTIVHHSSLESPLSQNYSGNFSLKKQDEKMKGIKRPNPFSMDIPPMSSSNFKPLTFPYLVKESETISCKSGRGFNLDFTNSTIREIPSSSASNSQMISKKSKKENKKFGGDFLSLAPPTTCSHYNLKSPSFPPFYNQGKMKDQVFPALDYNQINKQKQLWNNFIPSALMVTQTGQPSNRSRNHGARGENNDIDLTLKL